MKENSIFLKEESLFISKVNSLFNNKEYLQVAALRHKVFENIDLYKKTEVIYQVASSLFFGRFFEETISFIDELRKKEVESMLYSFYYLASCIALDDINLAKSYLKRSKLMNDNYISEIISEDGANYSSILNVENIDDILNVNVFLEAVADDDFVLVDKPLVVELLDEVDVEGRGCFEVDVVLEGFAEHEFKVRRLGAVAVIVAALVVSLGDGDVEEALGALYLRANLG